MNYIEISLSFTGRFFDRNEEPIQQKGFALQYFDVKEGNWSDIAPDITISRGVLNYRMVMSARLRNLNSSFLGSINGGAIPMTRLIDKLGSQDNKKRVLAVGNLKHFSGKGEGRITLGYHFGDLYVMPAETEIHSVASSPSTISYGKVGLPRFVENSPYHKAMRAALKIPQRFSEYDPEKDTVTVHAEGTTPGGISTKASALKEVYTNVINEVNTATTKLEKTPFTLTNVSLNLKAHVKDDVNGFQVQLVDAASSEHLNPAGISDVKIDVATEGPSAEQVTEMPTPNVVGLTETATRKRLDAFGLKLEVIYQVFQGKVVGQAAKQIPAAGEDITPGSTVTVIFAKNGSNFN